MARSAVGVIRVGLLSSLLAASGSVCRAAQQAVPETWTPTPVAFARDLQLHLETLSPYFDRLSSRDLSIEDKVAVAADMSAALESSLTKSELTASQRTAGWELLRTLIQAGPRGESLGRVEKYLDRAKTDADPNLGRSTVDRLRKWSELLSSSDGTRLPVGAVKSELMEAKLFLERSSGLEHPRIASALAAMYDGELSGGTGLFAGAPEVVAEAREGSGVPYRLRDPRQLAQPVTRDPLVRVAGAQVAYRNRKALERDFPLTRALTDEQLDAWILDEFAFISRTQRKLDGIRNSPIPVPDDLRDKANRKIGYRPPWYKRAAVVAVRDPRAGRQPVLVDIKGIGYSRGHRRLVKHQINKFQAAQGDGAALDELRAKNHSDGLMSLGEAVAELTRQQAAQRLFEEYNAEHGTSLQTAEVYFIIALPFSILAEYDGRMPAAALLGRQAQFGRGLGYDVPESIYADTAGDLQSDYFKSAAVDFGGVVIQDPRLAGPFGGDPANVWGSNPWRYGHAVAAAFARPDDPDRWVVYRHLDEMLAPLPASVQPARSRILDFEAYLQRQLDDPHPWLRLVAASALRRGTELLLERALNHPDEVVRHFAAEAASGRSSDPSSLSRLTQTLQHPEDSIRRRAAMILRRRSEAGDQAARDVRAGLLASPVTREDVKEILHN